MDKNYCQISIYGNFEYKYVVNLILKFYNIDSYFKTEIMYSPILLKGFEITVTHNSDYDNTKSKEFPDGFLYFPFHLEIDFKNMDNVNVIIKKVSELLIYFWGLNIPAVAVCDYEHLLIRNGGYNCTETPWPNKF